MKIQGGLSKIASGSITPTTHIERQFQTSINDLSFKDLYRSPNSIEVYRFGINAIALQERLDDERVEVNARNNIVTTSPSISLTPIDSKASEIRPVHLS